MNIQTLKISLIIKDKILENLHIVNILQNNDIKETLENITGNTFESANDFLKYRVLNFIKNTKYIKNIQENDNKDVLDLIKNQKSLELRDKLISSIIDSEKNKVDISNCVDINKVRQLLKKNNIKEIERLEIINPFNDLKTTMSASSHSSHNTSFSTLNKSKKNNKELNDIFHIFLNKNIINIGDSNLFKVKDKNDILIDFIFFHELAHSSYCQLLEVNEYEENLNEIDSDLVSIVKIIKENNLNIEDANELCNIILKYRSESSVFMKKPNGVSYMDGISRIRVHFTEESILNMKDFLRISGNIDYIKSINDKEISSFIQIFNEETKSLNNCTEFKELGTKESEFVLDTILNDSSFFKTMKNDYDSSHASEFSRFTDYSFEDLKRKHPATLDYINKINRNIIVSSRSNKNIIKDFYITHQLRTNFDNYIIKNENKIIDEKSYLNINIKFEDYKKNKENLSVDITSKTTSRQLKNKIKFD